MASIKTTIAGLITGLPVAIYALIQAYNAGTFTGKTGFQLVAAIGLILLGLFSKDYNTTGGTVSNGQTPTK